MAVYVNSVQAITTKQYVWGEIEPYPGSTAPTHEDTEGKGGYQCVANTQARDSIPAALREKGMGVFVQSTETEYSLGDDLVTWSTAPEMLSSNNLWVYSRYGQNSVYEQYEEYKWDNGRLDTIIISNRQNTNYNDGPIIDAGKHPTVIWKTRYIDTPTIENSGYDSEGGPCWSAVFAVNNYSITTAALSDAWGAAYSYTVAHGRWK